MQTGSRGHGDKENRPKVAKAKGTTRAKRTSKGLAEGQTIDLVVRYENNAVFLHCSVSLCYKVPCSTTMGSKNASSGRP